MDAAICGGGHVDVVSDEHDRPAEGVEVLEDGQHFGARMAVQVAGRLVGQDQGGLRYEGTGDSDALLLAA